MRRPVSVSPAFPGDRIDFFFVPLSFSISTPEGEGGVGGGWGLNPCARDPGRATAGRTCEASSSSQAPESGNARDQRTLKRDGILDLSGIRYQIFLSFLTLKYFFECSYLQSEEGGEREQGPCRQWCTLGRRRRLIIDQHKKARRGKGEEMSKWRTDFKVSTRKARKGKGEEGLTSSKVRRGSEDS